MTWNLKNHLTLFPNACVVEQDKRLYGIWMIGNNYKRTADYYGSYPPSYLNRVYSLFPDAKDILHLFSGKINDTNGITVDIRKDLNVMVVANAKQLPFKNQFDLVIADPPYSKEDAKHYKGTAPSTAAVTRELFQSVQPGGFVVWLCTHPPLYRKDQWNLAGIIGLHVGTNKRFRSVIILQRKSDE
jgi:hypothetical protein